MKTLRILTIIGAFLFIGSLTSMAQTPKKTIKKEVSKKSAKIKTNTNNNIKSAGAPVPGQEITTEQETQKAKGKGNSKKAKKEKNNKKANKNN